MKSLERFLFLAGLLGLGILLWWYVASLGIFDPGTPLQDFDAYMRLLAHARQGEDPYLIPGMKTVGPPLVFLFYIPFSLLPLGLGRVLMTILNMSALMLMCSVLTKRMRFRRTATVWLAILVYSAFVTRFAIVMGQSSPILALCIALLLLDTKKRFSVFLIPIIVVIKTIFAPLLLWAFAQEKRQFLPMCCFLIGGLLLTMSMLPISSLESFFRVTSRESLATAPVGMDYYNQSLQSSIYRLGFPAIAFSIWIVGLVLLAGGSLIVRSVIPVIIGSLLLSPISWQHYYLILFPIAVKLLFPLSYKRTMLFSLFVLLWWIEIPGAHALLPGLFSGLLASHFFLSGMLLLVVWVGARKRT